MFIVVILTLIPVIIWAFMEPLGLRFLDLNSAATSLGQIVGLIGMALFSINLILAGRFKFLDKYFRGLDKVYQHHKDIGLISFSLLLLHPLFLVFPTLSISIRQAALFFVPFVNMPITWGIISLISMIVLISLTIYAKIKYHIWKISHKFMLIVFAFAILHTLVITSDVTRSSLLNYYILTLAFIGLAVSFNQAFLNKFLSKKFTYKVKKVSKINENIIEIEMEPLTKKMIFNEGQFAFFSFFCEKVTDESHPFSISSGSGENSLKITVKNLGDYTSFLENLKLNDEVIIDGPYGNFSYKNVPSKKQIWIAGGIGITPFLSMARNLENIYTIDLYYSVKEEREAVYQKSFQDILQNNQNFRYNLWITKDKGYINSDVISSMSNGFLDKDIFLCGPSSFMESLKNQFVSKGVNLDRIHYENFSLF